MAFLDGQVGFKAEATYGTPLTVTKFLPYANSTILPSYGHVEAASLKPGQYGPGDDRVLAYFKDAAGAVTFSPATKSSIAGLLLPAMGTIATVGPTEVNVYTHTGTMGNLLGKSLTVQTALPDRTGTVVPYTFAGCKVGGLSLDMSTEQFLSCTVDIAHAQSMSIATGLAAASFPAAVEYFAFSESSLSVNGTVIDVFKWSVSIKNQYLRRQPINGTVLQLEATQMARPQITFSFDVEHGTGTVLTKLQALTAAGIHAPVVITVPSKTLLGTTLFPAIIITIPAARFDTPGGVAGNADGFPMISVSGVASMPASGASPITIAVQTADITP